MTSVHALSVMVAVHLLSAVIWIGSMFFSLFILKAAAGPLEPPIRLKVTATAITQFLKWVWVLAGALLASGWFLLFKSQGGFSNREAWPLKVYAMLGLGHLMVLLFLVAYFGPYRKAMQALTAGDNPTAGANFMKIRKLVLVNFVAGLCLVVVAGLEHYQNLLH